MHTKGLSILTAVLGLGLLARAVVDDELYHILNLAIRVCLQCLGVG